MINRALKSVSIKYIIYKINKAKHVNKIQQKIFVSCCVCVSDQGKIMKNKPVMSKFRLKISIPVLQSIVSLCLAKGQPRLLTKRRVFIFSMHRVALRLFLNHLEAWTQSQFSERISQQITFFPTYKCNGLQIPTYLSTYFN